MLYIYIWYIQAIHLSSIFHIVYICVCNPKLFKLQIWMRQEKVWEAEKKLLVSKLEQLQNESQGNVMERGDSGMSESSSGNSLEGSSPNLTEEPDTAIDEVTALHEANDKLVDELNTASNEVTVLQESNDKIVEELNTVNDDNSALKESNERLLSELTTANNKVTTLHEANAKLSESLAEETDHVSNLQKERAHLREDLDRARNVSLTFTCSLTLLQCWSNLGL